MSQRWADQEAEEEEAVVDPVVGESPAPSQFSQNAPLHRTHESRNLQNLAMPPPRSRRDTSRESRTPSRRNFPTASADNQSTKRQPVQRQQQPPSQRFPKGSPTSQPKSPAWESPAREYSDYAVKVNNLPYDFDAIEFGDFLYYEHQIQAADLILGRGCCVVEFEPQDAPKFHNALMKLNGMEYGSRRMLIVPAAASASPGAAPSPRQPPTRFASNDVRPQDARALSAERKTVPSSTTPTSTQSVPRDIPKPVASSKASIFGTGRQRDEVLQERLLMGAGPAPSRSPASSGDLQSPHETKLPDSLPAPRTLDEYKSNSPSPTPSRLDIGSLPLPDLELKLPESSGLSLSSPPPFSMDTTSSSAPTHSAPPSTLSAPSVQSAVGPAPSPPVLIDVSRITPTIPLPSVDLVEGHPTPPLGHLDLPALPTLEIQPPALTAPLPTQLVLPSPSFDLQLPSLELPTLDSLLPTHTPAALNATPTSTTALSVAAAKTHSPSPPITSPSLDSKSSKSATPLSSPTPAVIRSVWSVPPPMTSPGAVSSRSSTSAPPQQPHQYQPPQPQPPKPAAAGTRRDVRDVRHVDVRDVRDIRDVRTLDVRDVRAISSGAAGHAAHASSRSIIVARQPMHPAYATPHQPQTSSVSSPHQPSPTHSQPSPSHQSKGHTVPAQPKQHSDAFKGSPGSAAPSQPKQHFDQPKGQSFAAPLPKPAAISSESVQSSKQSTPTQQNRQVGQSVQPDQHSRRDVVVVAKAPDQLVVAKAPDQPKDKALTPKQADQSRGRDKRSNSMNLSQPSTPSASLHPKVESHSDKLSKSLDRENPFALLEMGEEDPDDYGARVVDI